MAGIAQGLIGSIKTASGGTPTNLITNGSFSVNTNGWTFLETQARDTSVFRSSPASYNTGSSDNDGAIALYTQNGAVAAGSSYSLSLWLRNPVSAQTFSISLSLGTSTYNFTSASYSASTSWQYIKFENQLCTGNTNFSFYIYSSLSGAFNIDDVSLVLGATAL